MSNKFYKNGIELIQSNAVDVQWSKVKAVKQWNIATSNPLLDNKVQVQ